MIPHNSTNWVGIDVSKRQLDLASLLPITKLPKTLPNTPQGHQKLLRILSSQPDSKVIFESTGGYEHGLFQALSDQGIHASRINPLHARSFARATGLLAKTDQLDAQILVQYGAALQPEATAPLDPERQQLQDLLQYRQHLYDQLHREKMQLEHEHGKTVTRMIKTRIKSLEKQITQLAQEAEETARNAPTLAPLLEILTGVKGVAALTALSLLAAMPELGHLTRKQVAALAGVAPMNCDSGTMRGQRRVKGGRREVRKALYMASLSAARHEPILKDFYETLKKNGKPTKVALTAVMRKLLIHLNALTRRHFQEYRQVS